MSMELSVYLHSQEDTKAFNDLRAALEKEWRHTPSKKVTIIWAIHAALASIRATGEVSR